MKPSLLIISDTIRSDLHSPLRYFKKFVVTHAYRQASYGDMAESDWAATAAFRFRSPLQLVKLVTSLKPDIVQLPEPTAGRRAALTTALLLPVVARVGAKVVVPFFENVPIREKFQGITLKLVVSITKRLIKQAHMLIYLNEGARNNLVLLGAAPSKLTKLFWGSWGVSPDFRPKLKVKSEKLKIVLYVGVISKRKGIRYLVDAMERVIKKVPRAKLWLVGPPGDFEPPQKSWIQYLGAKKNRDLPRLFQKSSVSVLASIDTPEWQEQVGMVNLQSLACGTPVITTRSGAIPEFVKDGEGAILVRQKDAGALAQSIVKILNLPPNKRAALSRKGRSWVTRRYQIAPNIAAIERLLARL
ncbi:MAG: glycosyltransferase family 4 protein [Patescibacteria group bacterium]